LGKRGYSIAGKPRALTGEQKPGPGQYDYTKYLDKRDWSHGICLPKSHKLEVRPATDVGPGGYNIDSLGKPSGFSFGKDKKEHEALQAAPGPGAYQLKAPPPLYNPRSFSKSQRGLNKSKSEAEELGPGAYEIKLKYGGGFKFGKDAREHGHDDSIPGPAKYNPSKLNPISNLGSFGRQKRAIDKNNQGANSIAVGPGIYVPKVENWSGGYSIGREKRKGLASKIETPGVGAYNIKDPHDGGYSFPHAGKPKPINTTPGFYKPMYSVPDVPKYLLPAEPQRKIHL
jgi:Sperm-tail PG-rich repeat